MTDQRSIFSRPGRLTNFRMTAQSLAGAALALTACHAAAQSSVTLFGHVDASVLASRSGAPGARTVTSLASGVGSASRFGMRGSEDLGGGFKALFQLEMGFDLDTGATKNFTGDYAKATAAAPLGPTGTGFNRVSSVGLETPYGTVLLGREYTPLFYTAVSTDTVRGAQYLGNIQSLTALIGGPERTARISNGIVYASPVMSGYRVRAAYGFGSQSPGGAGRPPKDANETVALGAEYVGNGLTVSGSLQNVKVPLTGGTPAVFTTVVDRRDAALGVRYLFGRFTLAAGHFRVIKAPVEGSDTWLGGGVTFGDGTLYAQLQRLEQDNPAGAKKRGTILGMTYAYNLSKRTTVYTSYGQTSNNATGTFGLSGNDVVIAAGGAGAKPRALAVGLRHAF